MTAKEELKSLVTRIKKIKNWSQEQVSTAAGYEAQTITQALSRKEGQEPVIKHLKIVFKDLLETGVDPDIAFNKKLEHAETASSEPEGVEWGLKEKYIALLEKYSTALERDMETIHSQQRTIEKLSNGGNANGRTAGSSV